MNRELDTLRSIFSKAVEWGQELEHTMRAVKRLKVDNRRTRILSEAEQAALLKACPKKLARMVRLALITALGLESRSSCGGRTSQTPS